MANKFVTSGGRFVIATVDGKRKFVIIKREDEDILLADCDDELFITDDNMYLKVKSPEETKKILKKREVLI